MPGWINVPVRDTTHKRLVDAKNNVDMSFDKFINILLDCWEQNHNNVVRPTELKPIVTPIINIQHIKEQPEIPDGYIPISEAQKIIETKWAKTVSENTLLEWQKQNILKIVPSDAGYLVDKASLDNMLEKYKVE